MDCSIEEGSGTTVDAAAILHGGTVEQSNVLTTSG